MLIKPYSAPVNTAGQSVITINQNLPGIVWVVYQIGFALGQNAPSPQIAAHINSMPVAATVTMQTSAFASIAGQSPYAMESFMVGPPYFLLNPGDNLVCAVLGATAGDNFTAAAYIDELSATQAQSFSMAGTPLASS